MARFCARVRKRPDLPTVSMKDVYRHPTVAGLAAALVAALPAPVPQAPSLPARWRPSPVPRRPRPASAATQQALAAVLAEVAQLDQVRPDAHFFDDLGADSLVMARFCARVRKRPDLPTVSMKDVYRHPTIASLAVAFAPVAAAPIPTARPPAPAARPAPIERPAPVGTPRYVLCGALQLVILIGLTALPALVAARAYAWISAGADVLDVYLRSVVFGGAAFVGACALPIVAKWVLVGRWRPQQIRIWSLHYLRFWLVKTLIRTSPLALFAGSPIYVLYLRALGAKIGRGVVILSRSLPVCTDLLTIGAGTVVRKDVSMACYRAHADVIQTGRVMLGRDVLASESTVLDIDTALGRRRAARPPVGSAYRSGRASGRALARVARAAHPRGLPDGRAGPLRHGAAGAVRIPPATRRGRALLPDGRRRGGDSARGVSPAGGVRGRLGDGSRRWRNGGRGAARLVPAGPRRRRWRSTDRGHRASTARTRHPTRSRLPPLRRALLDPPHHCAPDQSELPERAAGGQLLHRRLPAPCRIRPQPRRADRVELRPADGAREPVLGLDRYRDDGRRRAVGQQRGVLVHVLPRVRDVDRGAQLPRQRDRIPGAEPHRATTACSRPR